jgi:tRNA(Ile)-lysidine synthase TilS/MesJ
MGYESGWADKIRKMARPLGLTPEVVDARRPIGGNTLSLQIGQRMNILDGIAPSGSASATPCTYCYSVKALALEDAARRHESTKVAFAHHMTDAVASLLKEGLIHIDRWDYRHMRYDRANFEVLVDRLAGETAKSADRLTQGDLLGRIAGRVGAGKLDTDEPPRQSINESGSSIEVIRPLFLVDERLINQAKSELRLLTADSGCGHGATQNTETPREMIHFRVLYQAHPDHLSSMKNLVLKGIDPTGNGRVRARRRRAEFVGSAYKPPTKNLDKL